MEQEPQNQTEAAILDYKKGLGDFSQKMPKIAKHFNAFTEACFAEGKLSQKEKQLIALGIAVVAQDEYCIAYHTKGCLDQGASEEEIMEALGVSAAFGGGAAMSQAVTFVQDCITDLKQMTN
ncbi:carboxymuconolactone decarboxylase family protein [Bacillus sp. B15-48]|uniref:carboxymuconolactone decarboxylase family protein n=1 Tax=Bacillus sp. B15-48 TaxID=1548601 RepID=UPI00193F649A|nr:carboxymuconolactone decarboxylase family protein [Bacillus sp. B15-48]MBM4760931.1 carboxymuconolactone decarboxylase family protein [Bacillus sp. B15-48]